MLVKPAEEERRCAMERPSGDGPHWMRASFAIKYNKRASSDACAVYGIQPHPFVGPELFLVDT